MQFFLKCFRPTNEVAAAPVDDTAEGQPRLAAAHHGSALGALQHGNANLGLPGGASAEGVGQRIETAETTTTYTPPILPLNTLQEQCTVITPEADQPGPHRRSSGSLGNPSNLPNVGDPSCQNSNSSYPSQNHQVATPCMAHGGGAGCPPPPAAATVAPGVILAADGAISTQAKQHHFTAAVTWASAASPSAPVADASAPSADQTATPAAASAAATAEAAAVLSVAAAALPADDGPGAVKVRQAVPAAPNLALPPILPETDLPQTSVSVGAGHLQPTLRPAHSPLSHPARQQQPPALSEGATVATVQRGQASTSAGGPQAEGAPLPDPARGSRSQRPFTLVEWAVDKAQQVGGGDAAAGQGGKGNARESVVLDSARRRANPQAETARDGLEAGDGIVTAEQRDECDRVAVGVMQEEQPHPLMSEGSSTRLQQVQQQQQPQLPLLATPVAGVSTQRSGSASLSTPQPPTPPPQLTPRTSQSNPMRCDWDGEPPTAVPLSTAPRALLPPQPQQNVYGCGLPLPLQPPHGRAAAAAAASPANIARDPGSAGSTNTAGPAAMPAAGGQGAAGYGGDGVKGRAPTQQPYGGVPGDRGWSPSGAAAATAKASAAAPGAAEARSGVGVHKGCGLVRATAAAGPVTAASAAAWTAEHLAAADAAGEAFVTHSCTAAAAAAASPVAMQSYPSAVPQQHMREAMVFHTNPTITTVFALDGRPLLQNPSSVSYFGDWCVHAHNTASTSTATSSPQLKRADAESDSGLCVLEGSLLKPRVRALTGSQPSLQAVVPPRDLLVSIMESLGGEGRGDASSGSSSVGATGVLGLVFDLEPAKLQQLASELGIMLGRQQRSRRHANQRLTPAGRHLRDALEGSSADPALSQPSWSGRRGGASNWNGGRLEDDGEGGQEDEQEEEDDDKEAVDFGRVWRSVVQVPPSLVHTRPIVSTTPVTAPAGGAGVGGTAIHGGGSGPGSTPLVGATRAPVVPRVVPSVLLTATPNASTCGRNYHGLSMITEAGQTANTQTAVGSPSVDSTAVVVFGTGGGTTAGASDQHAFWVGSFGNMDIGPMERDRGVTVESASHGSAVNHGAATLSPPSSMGLGSTTAATTSGPRATAGAVTAVPEHVGLTRLATSDVGLPGELPSGTGEPKGRGSSTCGLAAGGVTGCRLRASTVTRLSLMSSRAGMPTQSQPYGARAAVRSETADSGPGSSNFDGGSGGGGGGSGREGPVTAVQPTRLPNKRCSSLGNGVAAARLATGFGIDARQPGFMPSPLVTSTFALAQQPAALLQPSPPAAAAAAPLTRTNDGSLFGAHSPSNPHSSLVSGLLQGPRSATDAHSSTAGAPEGLRRFHAGGPSLGTAPTVSSSHNSGASNRPLSNVPSGWTANRARRSSIGVPSAPAAQFARQSNSHASYATASSNIGGMAPASASSFNAPTPSRAIAFATSLRTAPHAATGLLGTSATGVAGSGGGVGGSVRRPPRRTATFYHAPVSSTVDVVQRPGAAAAAGGRGAAAATATAGVAPNAAASDAGGGGSVQGARRPVRRSATFAVRNAAANVSSTGCGRGTDGEGGETAGSFSAAYGSNRWSVRAPCVPPTAVLAARSTGLASADTREFIYREDSPTSASIAGVGSRTTGTFGADGAGAAGVFNGGSSTTQAVSESTSRPVRRLLQHVLEFTSSLSGQPSQLGASQSGDRAPAGLGAATVSERPAGHAAADPGSGEGLSGVAAFARGGSTSAVGAVDMAAVAASGASLPEVNSSPLLVQRKATETLLAELESDDRVGGRRGDGRDDPGGVVSMSDIRRLPREVMSESSSPLDATTSVAHNRPRQPTRQSSLRAILNFFRNGTQRRQQQQQQQQQQPVSSLAAVEASSASAAATTCTARTGTAACNPSPGDPSTHIRTATGHHRSSPIRWIDGGGGGGAGRSCAGDNSAGSMHTAAHPSSSTPSPVLKLGSTASTAAPVVSAAAVVTVSAASGVAVFPAGEVGSCADPNLPPAALDVGQGPCNKGGAAEGLQGGAAEGLQHPNRRERESLEEAEETEEAEMEDEECWHEMLATLAADPVTGRPVVVLSQTDVTVKVVAERHLAQVMEAEHRLLEQLFPRHILAYMAEEWTSRRRPPASQPPQLPTPTDSGSITARGSVAGRGSSAMAVAATAAYGSKSGGRRQELGRAAAKAAAADRPVVRDCNALATSHPQVTLLFADIKGFTPMCKDVEPQAVMSMLNDLYSRYDKMLDKFGVFKVETIGDCYFVAGGLIHEDADGMAAVRAGAGSREDPLHAYKVFAFAKAMLAVAREVPMPTTGEAVQIRVGLHSGPVVSGVVGTRMPRFCLFGDTVNTASRMESTGEPGAIHASQATYELLRSEGWVGTKSVEVKGKGLMQTYLWRPPDDREMVPLTAVAAAAAAAMAAGGAAPCPASLEEGGTGGAPGQSVRGGVPLCDRLGLTMTGSMGGVVPDASVTRMLREELLMSNMDGMASALGSVGGGGAGGGGGVRWGEGGGDSMGDFRGNTHGHGGGEGRGGEDGLLYDSRGVPPPPRLTTAAWGDHP